MAGEFSLFSGEQGHKMVREILNLIGWTPPTEHLDIACSYESEHKKETSKNGRQQHGIDLMYQYPSPLISDNHDIMIISSKHSQKNYKDVLRNAQNFLYDLGQDLECSTVSDELHDFISNSDRTEHFVGVLFWLASEERREYDIIEKISNEIEFKKLKFNSIYLVDNKRATFLVSAIKTAQAFREGVKVKFLYPHTGKNMHPENLVITDTFLPVQYINSSVLPVIMDDNNKISCLLFCNDEFNPEYLKRLVWLAHKLCGLTNEIAIFFRNYDETIHSKYKNSVMQLFRESDLVEKISVHRFTQHDFVSLKETQQTRPTVHTKTDEYKTEKSQKIFDDIDKILPFGEMLLPRLSSPILTKERLKKFLSRKGIYLNSEDKQDTVPIFSSLLLSPRELNELKELYIEKEDRKKEIERSVNWSKSDVTLWQAINQITLKLKEISATKNSKVVDNPKFKRVKDDDNCIELTYQIERENTTKDLLTGITRHDATVILTLKNDRLTAKMEHTSHETYKSNLKLFQNIEKQFHANEYIETKFEKIAFGNFETNKDRLQFLLSFLDNEHSPFLKDEKLENIKIRPDETIENLPEDLASMKGKVSNLNITGTDLDKLYYIEKEEYKKAILCEKVKIKYKFDLHIGSGHCIIDYGFPGALSKSTNYDAEFQTSIWITESKTVGMNYNSAIRLINKEITKMKMSKYNKIMKKYEPEIKE